MSQELFYTTNIKVAAVLIVMGFKRGAKPVTHIARPDGSSSKVFWFEPKNKQGELAKAVFRNMTIDEEKFLHDDPGHPINWMREVLKARDGLVTEIHNTPRSVVVDGQNGRKASIPENATEAQKQAISEIL